MVPKKTIARYCRKNSLCQNKSAACNCTSIASRKRGYLILALYQGEYSRERLILRLRTVHPKTITRLAQNDTGNVADRHMKQILSIYNGAGRTHNLPCKR